MFHVHQDQFPQINDENNCVKTSKTGGIIKKKQAAQNKTNTLRAALQPLINGRQNTKRFKLEPSKTNTLHQQEKKPKALCLSTDVLDFKPVCRKVEQLSRLLSITVLEREYEEEIWQYLLDLEKRMHTIKPHYMTKQMHLSWDMRSVLIDWLVSVAQEYKMNDQTVHLSVNYLDRFLSNISVIREKFQLVGATAMMIAGKVDEIYPPESKEWSYLTGDTFTIRQFLKMEQLMLKVLNFEMQPPTMLDFIRQLCAKHRVDTKTMNLAMYLSELMLLEGQEYLKHLPSKLAASSVALARHTLFKAEAWPKKLEESAGFSLRQLSPVVQRQQRTFKSSPFKEQQAIQKKYASDKYQRVALLKPRMLILDDGDEE